MRLDLAAYGSRLHKVDCNDIELRHPHASLDAVDENETGSAYADGGDNVTQKNSALEGRRTMIMGLGVAAAGLTLGSTSAEAQARRFSPARHEIDAWLGELPGRHRIFVDTSTTNGAAEGLIYTNNLYDAQVNAYGGAQGDLAMIVCFRHFSTPFGYNDAMWKKYGETFSDLAGLDEAAKKAAMINLLNTPGRTELPSFGITVASLQAKGAQIAICNAATHFVAMQLAQRTGGAENDLYEELVANAIPNSRFVPAGVMALTRAQEYGYSVLIAG